MSKKFNTLYNYALRNVRVVDGDTLEADVDLGFNIALTDIKIRLAKINCPEVSTEAGVNARVFAKNWVESKVDSPIVISVTNHKKDKYGRILGDVSSGGESLAQMLEINGHAKPYDGKGAKPA